MEEMNFCKTISHIPFYYYFLYKYFFSRNISYRDPSFPAFQLTDSSKLQCYIYSKVTFIARFVFGDQISDNLPRGRPQETVLEFLQRNFFITICINVFRKVATRRTAELSLEQSATLISIHVFLITVQSPPTNQNGSQM